MINRILLAVDGSSSSDKAARHALSLARQTSSSVTILNVGPLPVMDLMNYHPSMITEDILPQQVEQRIEEYSQKILGKTLEVFKDSNIKVDTHFEFGHPAETITQYASENNYDLIVVGNRGLSEIKSLFLGSVSDKIIHMAHCPVLVVK